MENAKKNHLNFMELILSIFYYFLPLTNSFFS